MKNTNAETFARCGICGENNNCHDLIHVGRGAKMVAEGIVKAVLIGEGIESLCPVCFRFKNEEITKLFTN